MHFEERASASEREAALRAFGAELDGAIEGLGYVRIATPGDSADAWNDVAATVRALAAHRAIASAEADSSVSLALAPNDQYYATDPFVRLGQWGVRKSQVDRAWDVVRASSTITVAIIDTGVDPSHPDLAGALLPGRTYLSSPSSGCTATANDDNGHGTNVTGILAANANNGIGIAGVAFGVRVLPLKALDCEGTGLLSDVANAIVFAADQGAKIVSISLGSGANSSVLHNAVRYAASRNVLVIAAGGNCGVENTRCGSLNEISYPAAYPEAVAVGATDTDDTRAPFSTQGSYLTVAAPGRYIVSTVPTYGTKAGLLNYAAFSGTSQATPFVAGIAALVWTREPALTAAQVRERLIATVDDLGVAGHDGAFGAGRVNALRAVSATTAPAPTAGYGATYGLSNVPKSGAAGATLSGSVILTNTSSFTWIATGPGNVRLGYQWRDASGATMQSGIAALPANVPQGATVNVPVSLTTPTTSGTYTLRFDLQHDGVGAFSTRGVAPASTTVTLGRGSLGATYNVRTSASSLALGATSAFDVTLTNSGSLPWPATGPTPVRLSYHWLDARGATVVWDGPRTALPRDIAPGETIPLTMQVTSPPALGAHILRIDLVQDGVAWFSSLGIAPKDVSVIVSNGWAASYALPPSLPLLLPGARALISVTAKNEGTITWRASGAQPMRVAAHIADQDGATVLWDGERALLTADVPPGGSATVLVPVAAPLRAGAYRVRVDVVQEGVTWASANGVATGDAALFVVPDVRATLPTGPLSVSRANPTVSVQITNSSAVTWTPMGVAPVVVSSHWLDASGRALVWDGPRAPLPKAVAPGESVTVTVPLAPVPAGAASVVIDLVSEGIRWFGAGAPRPVTLTP